MKPRKVPKTHREIVKYASKRGATFVHGTKHTKIYGPDPGRPVAVPRHGGQIPTGTLGSIMRGLKLIGILMVMFACSVVFLYVMQGLSL